MLIQTHEAFLSALGKGTVLVGGALRDYVSSESEDLDEIVASSELRVDVAAALGRINPDQRAALVLVDMEGYSVEEAARMLGCAEGTIKSRCSRGRAKLAGLLAHVAPAR